eukprot:scaffold15725_cov297-Alexandrium_tamarense.AAC.2
MPSATITTSTAANPPTISAETKLQNQKQDRQRQLKRQQQINRLLPYLLTVPYIIGVLWTTLHPIVSVITGELKCRGSYIDENGLDVHRHRVTSYPLQRVELPLLLGGTDKLSATRYRNGMCASIISKRIPISPSIECYHHRATDAIAFDIVRILPAMGPIIESAEAIVIVVGEQDTQHRLEEDKTYDNANGDWYDRSDMNASIMHMIQKLGNKETCPWLTKNVFIVSPVLHEGNAPIEKGSSTDLADAVDAFIASYTGSTNSNVRPLPPDFSYPMIRSLLVLSD